MEPSATALLLRFSCQLCPQKDSTKSRALTHGCRAEKTIILLVLCVGASSRIDNRWQQTPPQERRTELNQVQRERPLKREESPYGKKLLGLGTLVIDLRDNGGYRRLKKASNVRAGNLGMRRHESQEWNTIRITHPDNLSCPERISSFISVSFIIPNLM